MAGGGARDRINVFVDFINPDNNEYLVGIFANRGLSLTVNNGGGVIIEANKINSPDVINGASDNDKILCRVGDDVLNGGLANDLLFGSSGQDVINGGAGNDVMLGLQNADTFIFELESSIDAITDFTPGSDVINLAAYGFVDFGVLSNAINDIDGRVQINMNGNLDVLRLTGVLEAELLFVDFILS